MQLDRINITPLRWAGALIACAALLAGVWSINSSIRANVQAQSQKLRQRAISEALDNPNSSMTVFYDLLDGWNLVAFPIAVSGLEHASDIMRVVAEQGGYVTTVSHWDGDKWVEYSMRADQTYGFDFPLNPQAGYFIRNHTPTIVSLVGRPIPQQLASLDLHTGWNAVALPEGLPNAEAVLDQLNQKEAGEVTEINRFNSGSWQPFVKRSYDPADVQSYGDNFAVDRRWGYFVEVSAAAR